MRRQQGFSLLEMLVVLLIVGITVSMVSLGVTASSRERELLHYSEWFAREASLGLQEAEAEGRHRGAALYRDSQGRWRWQWYTQREGRWQLQNDERFAAAELPPNVEALLQVDGKRVEISGRQGQSSQTEPDIVFFNSGELTPFVFRLSLDSVARAVTVCAGAVGKIAVLQAAQGETVSCEVAS